VDAVPGSVDDRGGIPTRITRAPSWLWEPGDDTGTAIGPVTCDDVRSSTIHSPYFYFWFDSLPTVQRKRAT
jgi:hypothetical protein